MIARNRNGRAKKKELRHTNRLLDSVPDMVTLGMAVEARFLDLCKDYLRITGEKLEVPSHVQKDFVLWREMRIRHKKEDFRNTEDEKKATKNVAEWTLRVNCEIRNQKYEAIDWAGF